MWIEIQCELINLSACKFIYLDEPDEGELPVYILRIDGREITFTSKKEANEVFNKIHALVKPK